MSSIRRSTKIWICIVIIAIIAIAALYYYNVHLNTQTITDGTLV